MTPPLFHPDVKESARFWRRRAAILSAKLNFHHWLARVIPLLAGTAVIAALLELVRRENRWPWQPTLLVLILGTVISFVVAWIQSRSHLCSRSQAMAQLETVLGLHNRLSAAAAGVVPWPSPVEHIADGYRAGWQQILMPLLLGAGFLALAHVVPVSSKAAASSGTISPPPDFAQVQSWVNALKAADIIEPDKVQALQTALDQLRNRPPQDWYTQSNLEAANSLKELTEQAMNSLSQDLDHADQSVEALRQGQASNADSSSLRAMQDQLSTAAENLASGNLPLKRELVNQMKGADAASDKALSTRQLAQLHSLLQKGKLAAKTAPRSGGSFGSEMEKAMASAQAGGYGQHRRGQPGAGGLGGGKETAPLSLQERGPTTPQGALTSVSSDDMSHTALGETLRISASKPNVDPASYTGTSSAGTAQTQGNGGEAVWRSTYDPDEADTLAHFFK